MDANLKVERETKDVLRKLSRIIIQAGDLDKFLNSLTQLLVEIFGVAHSSIALLDEENGRYSIRAITDVVGNNQLRGQVKSVENIASWLIKRDDILYRQKLKDSGRLKRLPQLKEELETIDSFISAPLSVKGKLIGILNLGGKQGGEEFSAADLKLLSSITDFTAALVELALTYHKTVNEREHQRSILNSVASGVVTVDKDGIITVFNRSAEEILGFEAKEVLGKEIKMLQGNLAELILNTLNKGQSCQRKEMHILPNNILLGVSTTQLRDAEDKLLGAVAIFSDISEIKRAQRKNIAAYWENLAISLAHEVKNSLVSTKALGEMLHEKYADKEYRETFYHAINRDTQKLDDFTKKVMDLAQAQEFSFEVCNVKDLLDAVLTQAAAQERYKAIKVEKIYSDKLPKIPADYHRLKVAFMNLVNNALEAMGKKGKLTLSAKEVPLDEVISRGHVLYPEDISVESMLAVEIKDTGKGIPKEFLGQIFDPFFTTKAGQPGIGLPIASKIVEAHKGTISVAETSSRGTTVVVYLPIA